MSKLSALALVTALAACGPGLVQRPGDAGDTAPDGDPPVTTGTPWELQCASCHGAVGEGGVDAPQVRNPVDAYARFVVRNGHDVMGFSQAMPAFDADVLSDDDLDAVIAFLQAQPKPTTGAGLYERMCFNCHGGAGDGGGRVDEDVFGEDADEIEEIVRAGHRAANPADREYMPAFSTSDLSDAELALIVSFLGGAAEEEEEEDEE